MMDSTSNQVGTMLGTQNAASLKLWQNLKRNQQHGDGSLPPGLVVDVVEFSRTTENILKTAYRLTFKHIFSPGPSWEKIKDYVKPVDGDQNKIDHLTDNE